MKPRSPENPEKDLYFVRPNGALVRAPRNLNLKPGWRVASPDEVAAAQAAVAAQRASRARK